MKRHRWIGVVVGLMLATVARGQSKEQRDSDLRKLQAHNMSAEPKALLQYFYRLSLKEGDAKHLADLVKKLGSDVYREREPARKELIRRGPVALPFLRTALTNTSLETKRRAEGCILDIETAMQTEPIAEAARVLVSTKDPKAAEALFNFLPSVGSDPFLEEEVLACVGRLTIDAEKVDPLLLDALKDDLPFRRVAAAYLIGRRANAAHRDRLRDLLADDDALVRERVGQGLYGKRPPQALEEALSADQSLLRTSKIDVGRDSLLAFFRKRTLSVADQDRFRALVKQLGHSHYVQREKASKALLAEGIPVLAFLKEAEYDSNVERSRRARVCLDEIQRSNNTAIPIAAAHLLTKPAPKSEAPGEAIRALLAYIPFVDDEAVEEEMLNCLTLLSLREPKVEPALVQALGDASPARRAAAAFVLGHVGTKEQVAKVAPLLDDLQPVVRLRAAQGLLAARDKTALPSFVSLLKSIPAPYLPKVEETLYRVAEEKGPNETIYAGSSDSRQKAAKAWEKWLSENQATLDLTLLNERETYLGLVTICEYDSRVGNIQGQVSERSRNGPTRWTFNGVMGAMDAHTLPNGRVLVAENSASRVTERDTKGNILWEYRVPNPISCQRLPNGNTFIASYNTVMEVTPAKAEVYRYTPGPQFYIFSAHKAKNGHIVAITAQGQILELNAKGQQVSSVQINTQGNWCSVEMQPNGNYLVASMFPNNGSVREIDRRGTEIWSQNFPGAFRATKLPNGNVLVASMNSREVAEMDRSGAIRWRVSTSGRPWAVHYR